MNIQTNVKKVARKTPIWAVFMVSLVVLLPISYFVGHNNSTPALPIAFSLPDQAVLNHSPSYPHSKATFTAGPLVVSGTKCNITNQTVKSHGALTWQSLSPPGTFVTIPGNGSSEFKPHQCKTTTFYNTIPGEVAVDNIKLAALNHGSPNVWRLTGTIVADGYAEQVWHTESFVLLNPGQTP